MMLTNRPTFFFGQSYLYDTSVENFECVCVFVMSGCGGHLSQELLIKGGGKQLHRLLSKPTLKNHDICLRLYTLQKADENGHSDQPDQNDQNDHSDLKMDLLDQLDHSDQSNHSDNPD